MSFLIFLRVANASGCNAERVVRLAGLLFKRRATEAQLKGVEATSGCRGAAAPIGVIIQRGGSLTGSYYGTGGIYCAGCLFSGSYVFG